MIARIAAVDDRPVGSPLVNDEALGATSLEVEDAAPFVGATQVKLGDEILALSAVNTGTNTLTTAALAAAHVAHEPVLVYPLDVVRVATLLRGTPAEGEEGMEARVPLTLYDKVPVGVREDGLGEVVEAALSRDVLVLTDVLGVAAVIYDTETNAAGLNITAGDADTPPDTRRVRWLDAARTAIATLFGYQSGNFNVWRALVTTDSGHTQGLADLKVIRYTDSAVLGWLKVQGHNTDGSLRAISASVRLDDGSLIERVLQDNLGRSGYQFAYSGLARCNSTLTLTTSEQDVSGCSFTVPYTGTYILTGVFECIVTTGGTAHVGVLNVNGVTQTGQAILAGTSGMIASVAQQWRLALTAGHTVKLRASKNGAGGTLSVGTDHTTLTWHHVVTD